VQKGGVNAGKGRRGGEKGEERGKTGVQKRGVNAGKGRRGGEKGEEIRKTGVQNNCVKTKAYKHPSRESFFIYPDCFCYQKVQGGIRPCGTDRVAVSAGLCNPICRFWVD